MAEKFSKDEAWYIEPFFTNLDRNIFAAKYLPSEVLGALASRYSRSTKGVRRLFYDEYIKPILEPNLEGADKKSQKEAETMKRELVNFVDYLHNNGGFEAVVNSKRARDFFQKWLAAYGDDSIAQLAGAHIFLENVSNIATQVLEDFRIGFAPLEKSTRYVAFNQKVAGKYQYYIDPDLAKSAFGREYVAAMNMLFKSYSDSLEPLSKYLRKVFKQEPDQSDRAYQSTINAKSYDVLRYYLPAATLTNVGFFGVGQAFEYVITKCYASPIAEIRQIARAMQTELSKVIPSMVDRASGPRGKVYQKYVSKTEKDLEKLATATLNSSPVILSPSTRHPERSEGSYSFRVNSAKDLKTGDSSSATQNDSLLSVPSGLNPESSKGLTLSESSVGLVEWDADAEDRIVASILYKYSEQSYQSIKSQVSNMSAKQKLAVIRSVVKGRQVRQHRLIRAFENTYYKFDIIANFGAYRDLHRHRMLTQERQRFTTELGLDVPPDLAAAKLEKPYLAAANKIDKLYRRIKQKYPDQAQYLVMMGNLTRWYQYENLRELGWEAELRTGPQGHPDYRRVEHAKVRAVKSVHPSLVEALKFVDFKEYSLARRESEKKIDKKLGIRT